jgi:hypothetical protein
LRKVSPSHALAGLAFLLTALSAGPLAAQDFRLSRFARFDVALADNRIEPAAVAQAAVPENAIKEPRRKRFWAAAGELALLEVIPWAWDRYVQKEDFAYISWDTVRENFKTGFQYDNDHFLTNQSSHPYHGGLFFSAGRSNGYNFWESSLFALAGSLIWECCMENTPPSINDLVNTTLGGMTRGEVSHRLSIVVLDNTATGADRVWREIVAAILNPVNAFNRLVRGEMFRQGENPSDRFPRGFSFSADLGYRNIKGDAGHPDQAMLQISALYGDPFKGDIKNPFDSFYLGVDFNQPGGTLISRIEERGILKGWDLTETDSNVRHIAGFSQEYEYLNNEAQVFGAQMFSGGLLSRYVIKPELFAITDVTGIVFPLAAVQTTDFEAPQTGRNYDFAPGGGVRALARLYYRGREILGAGYAALWMKTVNGVSDTNTLQAFRAVARIPIAGPIGAGAGYSWYSRKTKYTGFFEARKTQNEWRAFINWVFPYRR